MCTRSIDDVKILHCYSIFLQNTCRVQFITKNFQVSINKHSVRFGKGSIQSKSRGWRFVKFFQQIPFPFLAKIHDLPIVSQITLRDRISIHQETTELVKRFRFNWIFIWKFPVSIVSVLAQLFQWYTEVRFFYLVNSIAVRRVLACCWMGNAKKREKKSGFRLVDPYGQGSSSSNDRSLRISRHARRKFHRTIRLA